MRLLLISALFLVATVGNAIALDEIGKVEKKFKSVKTFSAKFEQKFFDVSTGDSELSNGTVVVKKPLKMVWEYKSPTTQKIISDGKTLFLYTPEEKEVVAEPIGDFVAKGSPLLFFAGSASLSSLFTIELANQTNKATIDSELLLSLKPKEKSLNLNRIILRADKKEWQISGFSIYDWTGNRTDISFTDIKVNRPIDNKSFIFNRPKGVEQVEMPKLDFGVE